MDYRSHGEMRQQTISRIRGYNPDSVVRKYESPRTPQERYFNEMVDLAVGQLVDGRATPGVLVGAIVGNPERGKNILEAAVAEVAEMDIRFGAGEGQRDQMGEAYTDMQGLIGTAEGLAQPQITFDLH